MNVLQLIDYFYAAIVEPEKLSNIVAVDDKRHFAISALVLALVSFTDIVARSLLSTQTTFFYYKITYGFLALFCINALMVVVYAGLVTVTLHIAKYQVTGQFIINVLSLSQIPRIFIVPVVLIFESIYFAPVFFYTLASIMFFVWSAVIAMKCISSHYSIDVMKTIGYLAAPFIAVSILGFLILVAGIMIVAGLLA